MHEDPVTSALVFLVAVGVPLLAVRHRRTLARGVVGLVAALRQPRLRPDVRPIEVIAADARRLRTRYRYPPPGIRFAKYEGIRRAYDAVLGEACTTLGHPHLLEVLHTGDELDAERDRVEDLLDRYGFHLQDAW